MTSATALMICVCTFSLPQVSVAVHVLISKKSFVFATSSLVSSKVTVTLAEPGEGGPDYDEDVEVKIDASLSGDELRSAVRDAIGKEGYNRKNIYKFKYEKA